MSEDFDVRRQWRIKFFTGRSVIMDIELVFWQEVWIYRLNNLIMDLSLTNTYIFSSQDINWWTGVMWITCGLLWCFYQPFELSFRRHPFTVEQCFPTLFLEAHQQCSFWMSPLYDQYISGPGVSTNELMSWFRCVWLGKVEKYVVLVCLQEQGWETLSCCRGSMQIKWCNAEFFQICSHEETNSLTFYFDSPL